MRLRAGCCFIIILIKPNENIDSGFHKNTDFQVLYGLQLRIVKERYPLMVSIDRLGEQLYSYHGMGHQEPVWAIFAGFRLPGTQSDIWLPNSELH